MTSHNPLAFAALLLVAGEIAGCSTPATAVPPPSNIARPQLGAEQRAKLAVAPVDAIGAQPLVIGLSISGGISLGAYEGGANWAIVEHIRKDTNLSLRGVTGASAGNINTLLTALEYCRAQQGAEGTPSTPKVDGNAFWNAWVPIGMGALLPGNRRCGEFHGELAKTFQNYGWNSQGQTAPGACTGDDPYASHDGLFSRRALDFAVAAIDQRMNAGLQANCSVLLGMTITAVEPEEAVGDVGTKRARFGALLEASVQGGRLAFREFHRVEIDVPQFSTAGLRVDLLTGDLVHFPVPIGATVASKTEVRRSDVYDLVKASSAFPLAFGPLALDVCLEEELRAEGTEKVCRRATDVASQDPASKERLFFDGGLFDNLPLGLTLGTMFPKGVYTTPEERIVLYIDPDQRRDEAPAAKVARKPARRGVGQLLPLVGGIVDVGRTRELQQAARLHQQFFWPDPNQPGGPNDQRKVTLGAVTRGGGVYGAYLGAFGAFLSLPMREYDFLVGLYDGMYRMALLACTPKVGNAQPGCIARSVHEQAVHLGLERDLNGAGSFVARRMLYNDLARTYGVKRATDLPLADGELCWIFGFGQAAPGKGGEVQCSNPLDGRLLHNDAVACFRAAFYEDDGKPFCRLNGDPPPGLDRAGESVLTCSPEVRAPSLETLVRRLPYTSSTAKTISGNEIAAEESGIYDNYNRALREHASHGLDRLIAIEKEDGRVSGEQTAEAAFEAGAAIFHMYRSSVDPQGVSLATSIPEGHSWQAVLSQFFPYYVAGDLSHGGLEVGYRLAGYGRGGWGFGARFVPWYAARDRDEMGMRAGLMVQRSLRNVVIPQLELGPAASYLYVQGDQRYRGRLGGELATYWAANRLRLAYSVEKPFDGHSVVHRLTLGVADLNGLIYWTLRTATR